LDQNSKCLVSGGAFTGNFLNLSLGMTYINDEIDEIEETLEKWLERENDLVTSFLIQNYKNSETSEFVTHGLARRLATLKHSIERIFEILPPKKTDPTHEELLDVTNHLQAFLINVYGAIDNLARIWCLEACIKQPNGKAIPRNQIGFKATHKCVRKSLSKPFQVYLNKSNEWFKYLEGYRDALAHRIPPYIPPSIHSEVDAVKNRDLELEINEARGDYKRRSELLSQQKRLGTFVPVMMHSFSESAQPVYVHTQLICDFSTVVEIGEHLLGELQAIPT
jgi:hypothetical protein